PRRPLANEVSATELSVSLYLVDGDGIGKNDGVGNDDIPSLFRSHNRRAGLDIRNMPLNPRDANKIAQSKRLLQQQEDSCKEILKDILKRKTYSHCSDSQHLNQISGLK